MNVEAMTTTEVKDPEYRKVADAILSIAQGGKDGGQDQETIRAMLHTFSQAVSAASSASHIGSTIAGADCKRHY